MQYFLNTLKTQWVASQAAYGVNNDLQCTAAHWLCF